MASLSLANLLLPILLIAHQSNARQLGDHTEDKQFQFQYHNGPLLTGKTSVNLIFYGKFKPSQRAVISDFIASLTAEASTSPKPSVATWWGSTEKYYYQTNKKIINSSPLLHLSSGAHILDENYSLGKSLTNKKLVRLASRGPQRNAINVVLTASDVTAPGFCSSKCGTHSFSRSPVKTGLKASKFAWIWVGNAEAQCPGRCAWPFHQPIYGPQAPPLVAPNNDVGLDGMVINLAGLLAGTVTNPFGNGFYQGPKEAPLEAASACPGIYGKGAYPGYAGELLVDEATGASYNANGVNGRKYLLPALFDPSTSTCSTLL